MNIVLSFFNLGNLSLTDMPAKIQHAVTCLVYVAVTRARSRLSGKPMNGTGRALKHGRH